MCPPDDLLVWYRKVREVSLPDIGNGGILFAVEALTGSPVYRLPAGEIVAGVYRNDGPRFDVMAENLTGILGRLRDARSRCSPPPAQAGTCRNGWHGLLR